MNRFLLKFRLDALGPSDPAVIRRGIAFSGIRHTVYVHKDNHKNDKCKISAVFRIRRTSRLVVWV